MRYIIDFSYSGALFNGYQKQPGLRTVQEEIEKVLTSINNNNQVIIHSSGRTDSKVNALHQIAHFDFLYDINCYKLKGALNSYLPDDIYINDVKKVDNDFHARYNVKSKIYEYKINTGDYNPMLRTQVYQFCKPLNIRKMKESLKFFIGTHDFTSFASSEDKKDDKVRTIFNADIKKVNSTIIITFEGSGFLKYQVRNMVGLLIDIGLNKFDYNKIPFILEKKDRKLIGKTAPSCGLTLISVKY